MKSSLTAAQQKTLIFIVGTLVLLGVSGGLLYDGNRRVAEAARLKKDADSKQQQAASITLPGEADQAQWAAKEKQVSSILLSDQDVPAFLEDITRLASENHLERLNINNEDKVIDAKQPATPADGKLLGLGISRYLVVTLKFQSEYPDAARFMGAVAKLPRPVEFQVVDMRRNPPTIDMTLILKVFKREPAPA